jgi:protein SCO1/2
MKGSSVKYWLILACVLGAMYGSFVAWRREPSQPRAMANALSEPKGPPLTDFVLTDQDGKPFDSASLRGKVWVGSFFFTNCPAVCWRLNQTLAGLQQTNPQSKVRYLSITCDPANDTPAALTKYAKHFQADPARWTFLTGDMNLIRRIGNDFFQVAVETETHSDRAFVVDRAGQVRGRFRLTEPEQVEMLKRLVAQLEAEPGPDSHQSPVDQGSPADAVPQPPVGSRE